MNTAVLKSYLLLIILLLVFSGQSYSQICINKYTAVKFQGTTYDTFTRSITTPTKEIISAGTLYDYNAGGHIAKFSEKGSPIWSYIYHLAFFDFVKLIFFKTIHIADIISTADGGYIIAGNVDQVLSPFGLPPPVKKWALMAKLDRFGKVSWTKTLTSEGELNFTNLCQTADGGFMAYLATDNGKKRTAGDHTYGKLLRLDAGGNIIWSTFLFTYLFDAGGLGVENKRAITQARNNNIILADVVHKTNPANGAIKEGNLHFLELDYATGNVNWETSYEYPVPVYDTVYVPDLVNVKELPDGKFSFISTLYLPSGGGNLVKKGVNIITSSRGVLEDVIAYMPPDGSACRITEAAVDKNTGNRTMLVDNDGKSMLVNIADNGQIVWKQGYNNAQGALPVNCFSAGSGGYNIFMSNNRSKQYRLLVTDATGAIDCVNETADITAASVPFNYSHDSVRTDLNYRFDNYYDYAHPLKRVEDYPLLKTIECQQSLACCTDFIDRVNVTNINICEGRSYMLPDSTVIQDSGLYDITFKTVLGCDSIRFYKVELDKDVSRLTLGEDTCLVGQGRIVLSATEGFDQYYWMNKPVQQSNLFSITQPGKYYVRVDNTCGNKTDSIEIFDQCDYQVYMPTAFTPNGDLQNNYFRIAPSNKNKLVNFVIYDRWGKLMFQTSNPATGWDGTYKNEPMSAGAYIYYLDMISLSGKRISQKGFVLLIR